MKRTDIIEKSLRRDRFMVIGTKCEVAGMERDLVRDAADEVFDLMMWFYEDEFSEKTFDFLMDIMTEFVSMREYGLALIIQDMLLQKAGLENEAASISKLLSENLAAVDMYLKQMAAKSILYHDDLIAEPCDVYTCNECPHRNCPDYGSECEDELEDESNFYADSFDNPDFYMAPEETEDSLAEDIAKAVADAIDKDGESDE